LELPAFLISKPVRAVRLPGLVARGVSVVAKGRTVSGLPEPLLQGCRALIADVADEDLGIHRPMSRGARPVDTYIEGVRTVAEAEQALASGACGVLGWPVDEAVVPRRARVGPELRRLIELMRFADRREPISRMDQLLQAVPEAASRFVRLINSAAFGMRVELPSFTHACLLLGHARLMPWLALLLVMSHWAGAQGQEVLRDEMFLSGVLSLLDRMTGLPFKDLVDLLPLSQRVQASLQGADGPYVQHLGMLAAIERCSFAEVDELADGLRLSAADVGRGLWSALASASLLTASES
jgi:EAL and modified HD-GYP domain-containing signal transduction protein